MNYTAKMRQELAVMLYELNGQELLDELLKYAQHQYTEGYDDGVFSLMNEPSSVSCEFD